jgi:two-component system response regulator AtoC
LAQGGSISLENWGSCPFFCRHKLLRPWEQKQIERVAGKGPIDIDIRIIAATNLDLPRLVEEKRSGRPLYRLSVAAIASPPFASARRPALLVGTSVPINVKIAPN